MTKKKPRAKKNFYGSRALRPEEMPFICAADVETDGLGGKLLSIQHGTFESDDVVFDCSSNMVENFIERVLNYPKPCIWFIHFAQYDWRYITEYISESGLKVEIGLRTETDIYEIRIRRDESEPWSIMRDSFALWSHSLEKLATAFCPEIPKLEIDIENFDVTNPEHIEYAKRDVLILLRGMPRLFSMIEQHFDVLPGPTAAGTAMRAWQRTLDREKVYDGQEWGAEEQFIRNGYYGGLVFLTTQRTIANATTFDLNSSYPASMDEFGVPVGKPIYTKDFEEHYPGFYRVRVKAPDDLIVPILPARNHQGAMRWYRGEFETVVSVQELQFATQHGYEVQDLYEGVFFERVEFPFAEIIAKCKLIREVFKGQTEEQLAKLIQNSLYGRFAARRDRLRMLHATDMDDEAFIGSIPFDEAGHWYIKKTLDEEMLCLPQWASFITANSRLRLLKAVYAIGPERCIYGDTDSITVMGDDFSQLDIGNNYGQWKLEKEWTVFRAIAPKVYGGQLAKGISERHPAGSFYGAAKGMPSKGMGQRQWKELIEDGATSAKALSLTSLKVSMKQGVRPAHELTRRSSTLANSMNFQMDESGNVRVKYAHG